MRQGIQLGPDLTPVKIYLRYPINPEHIRKRTKEWDDMPSWEKLKWRSGLNYASGLATEDDSIDALNEAGRKVGVVRVHRGLRSDDMRGIDYFARDRFGIRWPIDCKTSIRSDYVELVGLPREVKKKFVDGKPHRILAFFHRHEKLGEIMLLGFLPTTRLLSSARRAPWDRTRLNPATLFGNVEDAGAALLEDTGGDNCAR